MVKEQNHLYGNVKFKLSIMTFTLYARLLLIISMVVLIPWCFGEESVFITIVNPMALKADSNPLYRCYRTTNSTTRRYGRYANTRNGDIYNLPPILQAGRHNRDPQAQVVHLNTTNSNGFGIFYCQGVETNKRVSTVPTILLRSDAKIHPKGGFFTRTVNVGEQNVVLEAEPIDGNFSRVTEVLWRFNDTSPYIHQGSFSYNISEVFKQHEGVYEVYYAGERDQARHATMRLIVRDCPVNNRWGPPDCQRVCDKCYNGGVCDARSGKCICPPGFMGDNCLTGCGGDRFGQNCEFTCSAGKNYSRPHACNLQIFCLPDPYGCTCNTRFHTLGCGSYCPKRKFGAGCTQDCRCTGGSCNKFTGACEGGNYCSSGWSGDSCQIPDVCENDYYGPQCTRKCHCLNDQPCDKTTGECPNQQCAPGYKVYNDDVNCQECRGSTFGYQCTGVCRCQVEHCDTVTGHCNGGCLENWVQPDCQTGIKSLSNTKVNPGQKTVFTCRVTGNPTPAREMVILERIGGATNGITFKSTSVQDQDRSVQFDVNSVAAREKIVCRLMGNEPGALKQIQANTYMLPERNSAPRVICIGGLWAVIEWDAWNNNTDVGDPPVVAYRIHYRVTGSSSWTSMDIINSSNGLNTTLSGLGRMTSYYFSVSAVRSGTGGEGPRGPSSDIETTTCAAQVESFSNIELASGIVSALLVCIIIIIIVVVVIVVRRRRQNSRFDTTGHQGGITRTDNEQILMVSHVSTHKKEGEATPGAHSPIPDTNVAMTNEDKNEENLNPIDGEAQGQEYEDPDLAVEEDSWEISWEKMMLGTTILGKGNFGEVREGVVWKNAEKVKVAVKCLKDGASLADEKDFRDELETMKKVGSHPNIVTLIGSCIHEGILYVALELIEHGNLRSFLRQVRKDGSYTQWVDQLMTFALNVASGMRYLTNIGVIHRDLAARNVLLGDNYVAKVSDFGLSRDEDIYVQKSKTRIPVRWMPPESIRFHRYTSKSDVWSFGVLLWEIGALGGTPYAGIASKELSSKLKDGYRMPKPDKCSHDMYEIMTNCWQFDPDLRPTFRELHRTLSRMLDDNQIYMRFEVYENVKLSPINTDRDDC